MENVFFQQAHVTVTNSRFIVGNQTYAMRNITSVQPVKYNPQRSGPITLIIVGFLTILIGFGKSSVGGTLCGLALLALGIFWWSRQRPTYGVLLTTSGGEVRALQHRDWPFIENIVTALNQSIISHV